MSKDDEDNLSRQRERAKKWFEDGRTSRNSIERTSGGPVETLEKFYTPSELSDPQFVQEQCDLLSFKINKFSNRIPEHCERLSDRLKLLEQIEDSPLGDEIPVDENQREHLTFGDVAEIAGFEEGP